jgi:transcriptional regulator with XRE-family HTH domain
VSKNNGTRPPTSIDAEVGRRVRLRRIELGLSQSALASKLHISYQQFQKCEMGANRISAGRLFQIAVLLQVPISYFFENLSPGSSNDAPAPASDAIDFGEAINTEAMKFALAYGRLRDPKARENVRDLVRTLSKES